jgi:protein with PEP-CTERM/exosortase system signal
MKTNLSRKFFCPAVLATLAVATACGLSIRTAQAGYIVTLQQVGPNVVATGNGAIDLTDLSFLNSGVAVGGAINPSIAFIVTGTGGSGSLYSGFTGPTSFGSGGGKASGNGSGDIVGIDGKDDFLYVPEGYVSGAALSDSMTFTTATFASLGVTPGTYIWTWGSGEHADSFTLRIGPATAPDSGSTLSLLLLSVAALFGASRFRAIRLA